MAPKLAVLRIKIRSITDKLRLFYLRSLGLKMGNNCKIGKISSEWFSSISIGDSCTIQDGVDFKISHPFNSEVNFIEIGSNVFIGRECEFNIGSNLKIENNCWIASKTTIVDLSHETLDGVLLKDQKIYSNPILIKDNVWIGTGSIILGGIVIGSNSIVAAGSVVNKSIPENQVWGGVPVKFIKTKDLSVR